MNALVIRKAFVALIAAAMFGTVASAADVNLQAGLFGQRGDQDATGRALYTMDRTGEVLIVRVTSVSTSDRLMVYVDDQFVGTIQVINETGRLIVQDSAGESDIPLVQPGSMISLYRAEDGVQILFGEFESR
jgi:hypothetical protein